ncbi:MAG: cell surface protein SprA [Bacteroidales bacterium]
MTSWKTVDGRLTRSFKPAIDLGSVDLVGQASTPGWGSIEKKVNARSKETVAKYDLSSTIELGKFFPEKAAIRLPVYIGYSETRVRPQYNPLDPDIEMNDALRGAANKAIRDSILKVSEDYSRRKTITVSNAGTTKRGEKSHVWDPANLTVNYTYNEVYRSNIKTEIDLEKNIRGGLNYNYEGQPTNITPFKSVKFLNAPVFKIIKDFNFYLFPKSLSFRTDLSRYYNEVKTRNINNPHLKVTPTFRKDFEWTRLYDFKYDLTRQLKVDFTATNISRIDEPEGGVDKKRYSQDYDNWRDSVMINLRNFGRTTNYNHFLNINYNLPINKLPLLSWVNSNLRYGADYTWLAGPIFADSLNIDLGNTIKNHNDLTLTANATLSTLYSKIKFLKNIENNTRPDAPVRMKPETKVVTYTKDKVSFRPKVARAIYHNLKTRDVTVKVTGADGNVVKGKLEIVSENRVNFTPEAQVDNATVTVEGKVVKKRNPLIVTGEYLVRAMLAVRSVSLTVTNQQGQMLPGYTPGTRQKEFQQACLGRPFVSSQRDRFSSTGRLRKVG